MQKITSGSCSRNL